MPQNTPSSDSALTQERLKSLLDYDPQTGIFTWKINGRGCGGFVRIGRAAGTKGDSKGRIQIRVDGTLYFAHRLAFLWMLGRWPVGETDHINRDFRDNRWSNLREVTSSQNSINRVYKRDLPRGVYRSAAGKLYAAIEVDKRLTYLGLFPDAAAAHEAYMKVARKIHGEFLPAPGSK